MRLDGDPIRRGCAGHQTEDDARWTGPRPATQRGTAHHAKRSKVRVSLNAPFRAAPVYALYDAVFALRMLSSASPRASCRRSVPSSTSMWCSRAGRKSFCRCARGDKRRLNQFGLQADLDAVGGVSVMTIASQILFEPLRQVTDHYPDRLAVADSVTLATRAQHFASVVHFCREQPAAMRRLHRATGGFINADGLEGLLGRVLDGAIALTGADFANLQLVDPTTGALRIVAQCGFDADFSTISPWLVTLRLLVDEPPPAGRRPSLPTLDWTQCSPRIALSPKWRGCERCYPHRCSPVTASW